MADAAVRNLNDLEKARKDIAKKCYPAFDELLLYSLERRHLDVPDIRMSYSLGPKRSEHRSFLTIWRKTFVCFNLTKSHLTRTNIFIFLVWRASFRRCAIRGIHSYSSFKAQSTPRACFSAFQNSLQMRQLLRK